MRPTLSSLDLRSRFPRSMSVQIAPRLLESVDLGISDMRRAIFSFFLPCCSTTSATRTSDRKACLARFLHFVPS